MIAEIFMISAIVGIFWKATKDQTADNQMDEPEPENDSPELSESDTAFCFDDVQRRVSRLNQTVTQLETLERLLTDAEITAPEQHETALQMSWVSNTNNQNSSYSFMLDGRTATRLLTESLYQERETVRTSLLNQIADLYHTAIVQTWTERQPDRQQGSDRP